MFSIGFHPHRGLLTVTLLSAIPVLSHQCTDQLPNCVFCDHLAASERRPAIGPDPPASPLLAAVCITAGVCRATAPPQFHVLFPDYRAGDACCRSGTPVSTLDDPDNVAWRSYFTCQALRPLTSRTFSPCLSVTCTSTYRGITHIGPRSIAVRFFLLGTSFQKPTSPPLLPARLLSDAIKAFYRL
jgi:hypothetical protein